MRHWGLLIKSAILSLMIQQLLFAGITGKIVGTVTDAQSGEALPGANVIIEGTTIGCAADQDGNFVILNVPPGNYTVKVTMMGYKAVTVTAVNVTMNLTTNLDIRLQKEVLGLGEVVVVAERPVVVREISNSQMTIQSENLITLPVNKVDRVLTLQAGIESGSMGIIIRGGDANQTVLMVDGLSMNDERMNNPYMAVSLGSVEEIQVQTGGFNAEYGQARSGVVNIVTREGQRSRYSGSISFNYSPAAPKHFGVSVYDKMSYFNRPFFDPEVCWTGTTSGAWSGFMQNQYYKFEGWNQVAQATLEDNDPNNDLTPTAAQRLFEWYHRRQGDIKKPDYIMDIGFGGPIPFTNNRWGNPRFYLSHYRLRDMFVIPLSRDAWDENHTQLKVTFDVTPAMKLMLSGLYGEEYSVSPYTWTVTPTGRLLRDQGEIANLTNSDNRGLMVPYMPGWYSPGAIYHQVYGAKLTHTLSPRSLYEVRLQYKYSRHNVRQIRERDTTKKYEIIPGYFVDEAPYGFSSDGTSGPGSVHLGGWMNLGRDSTQNATTILAFDYTSQINIRNQLKTGFEFVYNDFNVKSACISPVMLSWTRYMIYRVYPYRLGVYLQDQMDYEGFVANFGLRLDYSDGNTQTYVLDPYSKYFSSELGAQIETSAPTKRAKPDLAISPRLGVSHPITKDSKLYFNYGHFRSEPYSSYRFRLQRDGSNRMEYFGDPNMMLEKTVAYELGYEQGLFNQLLLKIAAYYKDVTGQPGWILYRGLANVQYYKAANNNFADIRGFEITLNKRLGQWITGFVNYTYDIRSSGYFGYLEYDEDPQLQREYLRQNPTLTRRHPAPYARLNLDCHTPMDFGPDWAGLKPLGGWNLNLLATWRAGSYETYNPQNLPGVVDDVRWLDYENVDMRLTKAFKFKNFALQLFVDITNLFNYKYMSEAGFADIYDRRAYLESLNFSWEKGVEHGNDRLGMYRPANVAYDPLEPNPNNDPEIAARNEQRKKTKSYIDNPNITSLTFLNPRDITFGIRLSF